MSGGGLSVKGKREMYGSRFSTGVAAMLAVCGLWACAAGADDWKVPNWCPIVSEEGAVEEWVGKTWCGHVQGMCVSSNAIYFSFHNQIVKTDWFGRLQKRVLVDRHNGDICCWKGRLYTGVWLKPKKDSGEKYCGCIRVYDAETLELVKERKLADWHHGTDGITCLDGVIYMCMGRYAPDKLGYKNWYGKFDAETLESIGEPFIVDHGEESNCGSQNMTTDGRYIYSSYYVISEQARTPNLMVYDTDFNVIAKYTYGFNNGMDFVPGGKDGAVRFAFCCTPNWMHSREQPPLRVQGVVTFAELKDGRFSDLTKYGWSAKPIDR